MPRPRLFLNHLADWDWLVALEYGRVDEGQHPDRWQPVGDQFSFLRDDDVDGAIVGFKVLDLSGFDPEVPELWEIWTSARFDVPLLGLTDASAGEVVLAAQVLLDGEDTVNRCFLHEALAATDPEDALQAWSACLQTGDATAHYGLGCTYFELGRHREAYRHLRHYTEIAPHGSWNWCWYGKAAEAIGELGEARRAYRRALSLELDGDEETDAADALAALEDRGRA